MSSSVIESLEAIRAHITKGWVKKAWAVDADGNKCDVSDKRAVAFCLLGAFYGVKPEGKTHSVVIGHIRKVILERTENKIRGLMNFNDHHCESQEQMLSVLDQAIENAKKEAS